MIDTALPEELAISLHPVTDGGSTVAAAAQMQEFDRLIDSSGCRVVDSVRLVVRDLQPATLMGRGQVERIATLVADLGADVVFVDHPLTPVQQRNLEMAWQSKVVDRTGLILEIFAARARSREGVLQVQLASLNYQVGRLVRSWTHLERQRGGFGFMGGPGERQIELDRRMIRNQIKRLRGELEQVRIRRATQRVERQRNATPTVALVGYTNAGKSTLFNR
ncbi:MAG: GTPase HflX, partial [Mariprofundales bacterium]|nr:GTPase HflX [Mariprofundales bacterium]